MIRLYNHTQVGDKPLRAILTFAASRIGVTGDVAVKVVPKQLIEGRFGGMAYSGFAYLSYLQDRPRAKWGGRMASTPIGHVEIAFPWKQATESKLEIETAQRFLHTALHEMSHVRDYREHVWEPTPRTAKGRRITHDKRPCELRAENRVYDALQDRWAKRRSDELIIALAISTEVAGKVSVP